MDGWRNEELSRDGEPAPARTWLVEPRRPQRAQRRPCRGALDPANKRHGCGLTDGSGNLPGAAAPPVRQQGDAEGASGPRAARGVTSDLRGGETTQRRRPATGAAQTTIEPNASAVSRTRRECRALDGAVKSPFRTEQKRHPAFWMRPPLIDPRWAGQDGAPVSRAQPGRLPGDHRACSLLPIAMRMGFTVAPDTLETMRARCFLQPPRANMK